MHYALLLLYVINHLLVAGKTIASLHVLEADQLTTHSDVCAGQFQSNGILCIEQVELK